MNGPHDLGGRAGFGPIDPQTSGSAPDTPVFHHPWEGRALGLTLCSAALGHWTLDTSRHARESLHPVTYYTASYYQIWFEALCALLQNAGEVSAEELATGIAITPGSRPEKRLNADQVRGVLSKGGPVTRPAQAPAKFEVGAQVVTCSDVPLGHTRMPSYARGKTGVITHIHGCHVFPDTNAHGGGEQPTWLYAVEFTGEALWGSGAEPGTTVAIDAWERYLDPA